jgi:hypothetical protein
MTMDLMVCAPTLEGSGLLCPGSGEGMAEAGEDVAERYVPLRILKRGNGVEMRPGASTG